MKFFGGLFGNQKSASFSSSTILEAKPVDIKGANYSAFKTSDDWYLLKDVLVFGEVDKDVKGAPRDIRAEEMSGMVKTATAKYQEEKYCAPVHLGHHKPLSFADPEFLGYFVPKRVGKYQLDGKERDVVFADIKLKPSAFKRVMSGELPYISPEISWDTMEFSSLSFLDSSPPHFKFPNVTIGNVSEDDSARFDVSKSKVMGKFMALDANKADDKEEKISEEKQEAGLKKVKKDEREDTERDGGDVEERIAKLEANHLVIDKALADVHYKMGLPYRGAQMQADKTFSKADSSAPKEDDNEKGNTVADDKKVTKFEDDPTAVAKFAAQEARLKAMEDKLTAKETEEAKAVRVKAAFAELEGYPLTEAGKAGIAKFADDAEKLKTFIEVLKAQTPKNAPKSVAAFEANGKAVEVSGADPDLAEFQVKRPNDMPVIMKYAAFFESWKVSKFSAGSSMRDNRKQFIETMMRIDPTGGYIKTFNMEGGR
jgi:hypothetical protein